MTIKAILITILSILGLFSLRVFAQQKVAYTAPEYVLKTLTPDIVLHQNLRYGTIPDSTTSSTSDRILDLYLPNKIAQKKIPLYLFIHGGGFTGGDKAVTNLCQKIAEKGYAVASINYRLTLKNNKTVGAGCSANMSKGLPASGSFHPLLQKAVSDASEDAAMALNWLKKNTKKYKLDMNNVIVCGGSAGAMTALNLAYVVKPKTTKIKAVVNFWGGLENAQIIQKNAPPLLTFHGDKDDIIHVDYANALHKRLGELNSKKSKLNILEGKGHAQYKLITDTKIDEIDTFIKEVIEK